MGKFSGYLLLSDLDDTFRCRGQGVVGNSEAIRYFTANGGKFSFATGRSVSYLKRKSLLDLVNAPACLYNGGYVYDYAAGQVLHNVCVGYTLKEFLDATDEKLFADAKTFISYGGWDIVSGVPGAQLKTQPRRILNTRPLKFVFVFSTEQAALVFRDYAAALDFLSDSYVSRSWDVGVEITASNATKGHALRFIKKHMGNIHTAIGVGNYENDIPLLTYADLGVAVENASDCVKEVADLTVRSAADCGIAHLIELLDSGKISRP